MKKAPEDIIILHKCTKTHDHKLYCAWDMARDGCNCCFPFWVISCPFSPPLLPLTAQIMNISKKMKKSPGDTIILQKCTKNHDHMLYCSWDMAHDVSNCCFSFWEIFCPFNPRPFSLPNSPKNESLKKWKISEDIIILHNCTKNYDYRLYCFWDMVCDGYNCYFSFWAISALLPPNSPKNKKWKKWKNHLEISSFYTSVPKIMIICYTICEIWHVTYAILIFHFGLFFALSPS